ncbi:helix-turn-helix domain-containing protein [Sphingobacterium yanglingense]|uniref:Helix-turn-helix protein n=1 Tax=Sphingobacterium yanglingense TaxID=1437280 RepID=A0A4R6WSP2_9SPHI|nr:helix-turn-helix domain-containing protein [Sphingobacterium yanglingense]TDQ79736.1 helix-turn-helix protein [Sphingobacterium yanglingense]
MIPSFIAHFGDLYPGSKAETRLPRGLSYAIGYGESRTWHAQQDWCNIQWHNAKHVYLYSIEIETQRQLQIPVTISYPDIHWQYMLKGAYSLWDTYRGIPVLNEGHKHLIRGEQGHYTMEVAKGRHWIVGFNVAARWLERYPEHLAVGTDRVPHVLAPDRLYHSTPIPIIDLDRAELYYLLGLSPGRHILQDSQIYLPIAKLVEQMQTLDDATLSPIQNKIQAVKYYIQQCIATHQQVPAISALANHFCIEKNYLGRMYRITENENLVYYIYRLKQERAAELLLNKVAISSIVEQLGYSDSAAFRKAFKKYHGVYPSAYIHTKH